MEHNLLKDYYLKCRFWDDPDLMEIINEFIQDNFSKYMSWLEDPSLDDEWYRCDFTDADCLFCFEKWLQENYSELELIRKVY